MRDKAIPVSKELFEKLTQQRTNVNHGFNSGVEIFQYRYPNDVLSEVYFYLNPILKETKKMKEIKDMNLDDCLKELKNPVLFDFTSEKVRDRDTQLSERIYELLRWIPVSERFPTKEDGIWFVLTDHILFSTQTQLARFYQDKLCVWRNDNWCEPYSFTYWKSITSPL